MNHVTFTVAIEATFYLLAPFVLRRSVWTAAALTGMGAAWHVYVLSTGLGDRVWGYHFVLSGAYFFFLGACAYHAQVWYTRWRVGPNQRPMIGELAALAGAGALAGLAYVGLGDGRSLVIALLFALAVPILFTLTRDNAIDRSLGNVSYAIYLVHFPLFLLMRDLLGGWAGGIATLVLSLPAAVALYLGVEKPVDRWRQHRARARLAV